jgi:L-alanine-DL-glutamate epimerase-like enolase superfamily enzyme
MSMTQHPLTIERWALDIPFHVAFQHASATRSATQAIWIEARGADGSIGWGEGCPREYVTGESVATALAFVDRHREQLAASVHDLAALRDWTSRHRGVIDENPAAWCALELALLDLFARHSGQPMEAFLGLPPLQGPLIYSAVLGATDAKQFAATLARYQHVGMRDFKIKLSGDLGRDRDNLALLRDAGIAPARVRADANNLWSDLVTARAYLESLDYAFAALEEPLRPGQFAELTSLAQALDTRIVLDESITRIEQLAQLPGSPACWIVNLRVSKMGGLLRTLALAARCRELGLALIVGAQVGETSLLTRAALTVVQNTRDVVIAQEGAFGTLLLDADAVQPTLMFGAKGELDIRTFRFDQIPGFGIAPTKELATRFLKSPSN